MEWINIKDKVPDSSDGILITNGSFVTVAEFDTDWFKKYGTPCFCGHEFGGEEWEFDFNAKEITHWMPLPEPPTLHYKS